MDGNETRDGGDTTATARDDGTAAVTSARAQFAAAARPGAPARPANAQAVFDRLDWSAAVGATVQAATVHMDGRRDGAREVLMYDLDETGLLTCRDDGADGESVALHFISANSRDAYERVLRSVGYLNRAAEPHAGERRFAVEVVDATGFPVRVGERTLWVDARAAAATVQEPVVQQPAAQEPALQEPALQEPVAEERTARVPAAASAEAFDTLAPEVIRFDLDDHVVDTATGFDDAAFAARAAVSTAPVPKAAPTRTAPVRTAPARRAPPEPGPAVTGEPDGDRFAARYGDGGYWVHRPAPAMADEAAAPAPSLFGDGATIYHIYRPAGATAAGRTAHAAALVADAPVSFVHGERSFRVFHHRAAAQSAASTAPARHPPVAADRDALHFADLFEADVDDNGLKRDPAGDGDFLFGLGRGRAAA